MWFWRSQIKRTFNCAKYKSKYSVIRALNFTTWLQTKSYQDPLVSQLKISQFYLQALVKYTGRGFFLFYLLKVSSAAFISKHMDSQHIMHFSLSATITVTRFLPISLDLSQIFLQGWQDLGVIQHSAMMLLKKFMVGPKWWNTIIRKSSITSLRHCIQEAFMDHVATILINLKIKFSAFLGHRIFFFFQFLVIKIGFDNKGICRSLAYIILITN